METRRLEYFTALAEGGNFSRAAERLGISQPALSQQIQRLEEEVGAYLFDRTARPVVLTEVGERLLARSADVLEHIRAIERLSTAASRGETGRLRIGVIPLALYGRIPQQIREFRRRHPDVQVFIERFDTSPLIDLLEAGRIDVAFLNATVSNATVSNATVSNAAAPGAALRSADLDTGPLVAVLPVDHPLARASSVRLPDLRAEQLVMFPRDVAAENFDLVITAFRAAGFSPKIITAAGGYADQVGYVAAGVGYALLPREIECVRNDGVAWVPVSDAGLTLTMRVAWRPTKRGGLLRTFLTDLGVAHAA